MEYCLDCGMKLTGRMDKKFCDGYCRSHYNNALNKDSDAIVKEINCILKRNSAILKRLNQQDITRLTKRMLSAYGFDFNFFTHQASGPGNELYNYCYNYGYREIANEEFLLAVLPGIT